jgi:serine/threonine protein kinase
MSQPPRSRAALALGGEIAIKLLDPELSSRVDGRFRLMHEVMAAARIQSPNVVRVLDHGFTIGGRGFIVMERLVGENLAERLLSVRPVTTDELLSLVRAACAGLAAGHAIGLIHRSIDPDNLFLHQTEGHVSVKLLNFGMTPNRGRASGARERTSQAIETGPDYASPEQAAGSPIDARSDLYSLALVAYRCLAGRLPFQREGTGRSSPVDRSQPIRLSIIDPTVPRDLDAWFDGMLQLDPSDRPCQTAAQLADSFAAACGRGDLPAASDVKSERRPGERRVRAMADRPPSTRRRPWVLKGLAGVCSVAAAGAMFWRSLRQPEPRSLQPRDTTTPAPASPPAIYLHLTVSPKEARLTLDGQQLPSNPFASVRPADALPHRLRAEAPGYEPAEREVALARDVTLELALSPVAASAAHAAPVAPISSGPASSAARTNRAASPQRSSSLAPPGSSEAANQPRSTHELPLVVDRSNPWQAR